MALSFSSCFLLIGHQAHWWYRRWWRRKANPCRKLSGVKATNFAGFWDPPILRNIYIYIYTHLHIDAHICKKHIIYMSIYVSSISTYFLISNMDGLLWPGHPNLVELLGRRPSRGDWFSWIPMRLQQLDNLWLVVWKDMLRNKMGWIFAGWWFGRWIIFFHLLRKWDL